MLSPDSYQRRLGSLGRTGLLMGVVVFGALAYWQLVRSDLADDDRNPRVLTAFASPGRGSIIDREGNPLAVSLPSGARRYPDASLAHVLGYIDARYGSQGVELAFNDALAGETVGSFGDALNAEFRRDRTVEGHTVRLSIDPRVQAAAVAAFGARTGAVVALDPRTGEILAIVSVPTYDPGAIADDGLALLADPGAPLLNRATQGLYPPGSTFKTVTAAAVLEAGVVTPSTSVTCPGEIVIDGFPISCDNVPQGTGTYPFRNAYTFSVNAIFADVGVKLGWAGLGEMARRFGLGSAIDFALETAPTQLAESDGRSDALLASTAFGQGELLVTPLQMALVAATVAKGGVLARPIIALDERTKGGRVIRTLERPSFRRVLDGALAGTLRDLMVSVVDNRQANGVTIPGVKVAGKTGTAETGVAGVSHAWFIAFAPADEPVIALAVVVENGGRGGEVASPIAGAVIRAALQR